MVEVLLASSGRLTGYPERLVKCLDLMLKETKKHEKKGNEITFSPNWLWLVFWYGAVVQKRER